MTSNEKLFADLDSAFTPRITMGDDYSHQASGKGSIGIQTKAGIKYIRDVLLVPNLASNLLSVGQLMKNGYTVVFQERSCTIYNKMKQQVVSVTIQDSWVWHKRFCHLNFQGLKLVKERGMVNGLPNIEATTEVCEECVMGKQYQNSFPRRSTWKAKAPLEIVHTDICGKMPTPSLSHHRYFLTFIDDYSRMTWVYFLKEKSETFTIFKQFKTLVEKQSGCSIKTIRSDRGGEYT